MVNTPSRCETILLLPGIGSKRIQALLRFNAPLPMISLGIPANLVRPIPAKVLGMHPPLLVDDVAKSQYGRNNVIFKGGHA